MVGKGAPACRPLEVAELPLLGGIRGAWMDDERFVLADLYQSRLLVYSGSEGLQRVVNGWENEDLGVALQPNRPGRALREVAAWPALARQREWYGSLSDLATTGSRGGSAFALEITPAASFVRELVADGRRLESFPELPAPLPALPRDDFAEFYAVLEASSYPAGLYGDEDSLYVLMRDATGDAVVWDLHRIDPALDAIVGQAPPADERTPREPASGPQVLGARGIEQRAS